MPQLQQTEGERNKYWGRGPSMRFERIGFLYIDPSSRQKIRHSILACDILPLTLCNEP